MKRNGSALLIVLGMTAFMIVSAVAFASYIRMARLPSSYLRRSSASRQLAKAALARAIDSVDRAIANNPHPGVGTQALSGNNKNIWYGRVFCPTQETLPEGTGQTVPILTLEGLAYIPPPLVNEVRHYSRRTPTAVWQQFGFDTGRYAYCAVDVSDFFDVNRIWADKARSSSPTRRLSFSYLFETGTEHTAAGSGASEWDSFMSKFRTADEDTLSFTYDTVVPLVSVADLNLALGESGYGGFVSPFCKYIGTSGGDGFYNVSGEDEYDRIRRMTFVTDGWFPGTSDAGSENDAEESDYDEIYDLNDGKYQPFTMALLGGAGGPRSVNTTTILDIMSSGQLGKVRLLDSMPVVGLVALFDYLDGDHVPVSLACPTTERAPMVCAIKPNLNAQFSLRLNEDKSKQVTDASGATLDSGTMTTRTREVYQTYEYTLDPSFVTTLSALNLQMLVAYPFAHADGVSDTTFSVDGRATLFFSLDSDPVTLRTNNSGSEEKLHVQSASTYTSERGIIPANGTIVIPFTAKQQDFKITNANDEEDALFDISLTGTRLAGTDALNVPVARLRYKWTQTWSDESRSYSPTTKPNNAEIDQAECGLPPLKSNGEPSERYTSSDEFLSVVKAGGAKVTLNMAVTVRVADSSGKTVDLVPAHVRDDMTFNSINNNNFPNANQLCGQTFPVMRFTTPASFEFSQQGLEAARTAQTATAEPKSVFIEDPRFNYAPESWFDAGGDISKEQWLSQSGAGDRDGDIFLATSDQGYLQSIYELAFIPRFSDLQSVGANGAITGNLDNPGDGRQTIGNRDSAKNRHLMWSSYRAFPTRAGGADDFEGLGFTSAGTGMKVNPYSDSKNVLMAAFANTPVDWRMASTNNSEQALEEMAASDFNRQFAWNEYSTGSKFAWKDLDAIAGRLMAETRARQNWKQAWLNLGWTYDPNNADTFCGVQLNGKTAELWGADRKFLFGFWRECFAAKQQLFLIFVRAEPLILGGVELDRSPPQLGSRAVALVWRDPRKTTAANEEDGGGDVGYPHRTRVLFYRQLE